MKNIFYCTFGSGQKYQGYVQPVMADNVNEASDIMFALYGDEWSFVYTLDEWYEWKNTINKIGGWIEIELPIIDKSQIKEIYYDKKNRNN